MSTDLKARRAELQKVMRERLDEAKAAVDSGKFEDVEGKRTLVIPSDRGDVGKIQADLAAMRDELKKIEGILEFEEWGNDVEEKGVATDANADAERARQGADGGDGRLQIVRKTLGQQFIESEEFREAKDAGLLTMTRPFVFTGRLPDPLLRKDVYDALPSGTPGTFGPIMRDPIVAAPHRQFRVRDLFPAIPTTATVIEYFRVLGYGMSGGATNAASVIAQRNTGNTAFQSKPKTSLKFEGRTASVRRIAHWEAAHRDVLADEPQLRSIIDVELMYGLQLMEDYQILNGTGTGQDLEGILTTSGIQSYSQSTNATDNKADAMRRAATLVFIANFEATGVVTHPLDFEDIELTKSAGSEKMYLFAATIQDGGAPRVWRMPVVQTPAIAENTALVGAFGLGAKLYDREQANIRISEHHESFFVENAVAVLAELRAALAVTRPESFVKVTLTA